MTEQDTPDTARAPSSAYGDRIRAWAAATDRKFEANALASSDTLKLSMLDVVGEDPWTGGGITSKAVQAQLSANSDAKTIQVLLNSPGGDAFEGLAIQSLLRRHGARVEVEIVGLAASAASIIAMAGDSISIHEGSLFMVHAPWSFTVGDATEMRTAAEFLDKVNSSALDVYQRRTGRPRAELATLVADETWMTASEAVEQKFATNVINGAEPEKAKKPKAAAMAFMSARRPRQAPEPIADDVAKYAVGDRVEATADHMTGMKGSTGEIAIVRTDPAYYGVKFDGTDETHKWLAEDELKDAGSKKKPMKMSAVLGVIADPFPANTESPATPAIEPIAATKENNPMTEPVVPPVQAAPEAVVVAVSGVKLLGVATEAEANAKIKSIQNSELAILGATGKANMAEAMPVLLDWKQRADQHASLSTQVAELTAEARVAKRDAALERMSREGSLPPARHDWARAQFSTAEAVESFCAGMPKGFFTAVTEQISASAAVTLTEDEKKACQLTGVTEQAFLEQKKLDQQARSARVGG